MIKNVNYHTQKFEKSCRNCGSKGRCILYIKKPECNGLCDIWKDIDAFTYKDELPVQKDLPTNKTWFGEGCEFLIAQWEENEITGGPDYQKCEPVLVHCQHKDNYSHYEGNCCPKRCPLKKEK